MMQLGGVVVQAPYWPAAIGHRIEDDFLDFCGARVIIQANGSHLLSGVEGSLADSILLENFSLHPLPYENDSAKQGGTRDDEIGNCGFLPEETD